MQGTITWIPRSEGIPCIDRKGVNGYYSQKVLVANGKECNSTYYYYDEEMCPNDWMYLNFVPTHWAYINYPE